jgi:hypothetical protein
MEQEDSMPHLQTKPSNPNIKQPHEVHTIQDVSFRSTAIKSYHLRLVPYDVFTQNFEQNFCIIFVVVCFLHACYTPLPL